jgi:hypothetical protein
VLGLVVPTPKLPDESKRITSVPPSAKPIVSAPGEKIPVLVSPVNVIEGEAADPAANGTLAPPPVVTIVPDVVGRVNTVIPATAGASSVTVPDVFPDMTTELIIYFLFVLFLVFDKNRAVSA